MAHAHHAGHAIGHDHGGKAQQHVLHTAKGKGHEVVAPPNLMKGAGGKKMGSGRRMGKR